MSTSISVDGLHHGSAPIPAASLRGPLLVSSGINGMDPTDGSVPAAAEEQVRLVFSNIRAILDAAGGALEDVVKMTFFVSSLATKDAINKEWEAMYPDARARPARHTLSHDLRPPLLLQCEISAYILGDKQ